MKSLSSINRGLSNVNRKVYMYPIELFSSYIMQRFEEVENFDVDGVDNKNACYGGTQALMNTVNWVESSSWDGRLGVVICAGANFIQTSIFQLIKP